MDARLKDGWKGEWERQLMETKGAIAEVWNGVGAGSGADKKVRVLGGTTSCSGGLEGLECT